MFKHAMGLAALLGLFPQPTHTAGDMKPRKGTPAALDNPGVPGCPFPSPRYQRPLSLSELPMPEAEGPRTFWWVDYKEVEAGEISLRSSGQGEQVPRHRHKKKGSSRKKLERRELHTQEQQQRPQQQQQRQRQQRYRNSVKLQKQRERSLTGGSDVEPLEPTQNQHVQQQQQRRHRNSLQMQLHREPSPSDGSTTDTSDEEVQQGQQERQRRHRYRNSVHLELRQNAWKSGLNSIPEDSDEEVQDQQPSLPVALIPGKQQVQETPAQHSGGLQDVGELSESDWSDGDFSEGEEETGAAAKGPAPFKGQISPHNLEGSPLPAPVLNRAVSKINRRYEQCGDTARKMTSAEEELIDSVIQRWEKSGFQAFKIEGMTVNSGEQKLILHNEALTANLVDIYLRALEINKTPLTTSRRKRPKLTSLPVELASKMLSPSLSAEESEQLLASMETRRVLEAHITVIPLMKNRMHFSALVLDTIKGPSAVLFLLRWYDPFGESGSIPIQNILPLLKQLAEVHGLRFSSLYRTNFASEPTVTTDNDPRDTGVLCCMLATQLAEGCSPVASDGDALYFRKQMLLKLDFAGRWRRVTPEDG